jgi:hypothetical protein
LHSGDADGVFTLPGEPWAASYVRVVDTEFPGGAPAGHTDLIVPGGSPLPMRARSVVLFQVRRAPVA